LNGCPSDGSSGLNFNNVPAHLYTLGSSSCGNKKRDNTDQSVAFAVDDPSSDVQQSSLKTFANQIKDSVKSTQLIAGPAQPSNSKADTGGSSGGGHGFPVWAIVLLVTIGIVCFLVVIGLVVFIVLRKKKNNDEGAYTRMDAN